MQGGGAHAARAAAEDAARPRAALGKAYSHPPVLTFRRPPHSGFYAIVYLFRK
jgi:hypothetical protein